MRVPSSCLACLGEPCPCPLFLLPPWMPRGQLLKTWSSSCGPSLWPTCPPQAGPSCLSLSALRPSPPSLRSLLMGKSPDSSNTTSFKLLFFPQSSPSLKLRPLESQTLDTFLFFFSPCHFLPKVQVMGHPCGLTTWGSKGRKLGHFSRASKAGLCSQAGRRQGTWGACCVCREVEGLCSLLASLGRLTRVPSPKSLPLLAHPSGDEGTRWDKHRMGVASCQPPGA